ncbi:Succinate dehydrogenase hydrophobic membrane anchor protein [Rhodovulum sp. PH10]|uniref:succinate dehydrogenase, hydrophobic membrane anchor protein n=1 Tax=Rhodovulum sp. PH10 TaxID=1187851 RepID=UPI00027C1FE5|nr:succinate dehydrogenase, hydrophobic membrane anchor protein [Rhodovulum sp. PH10]EJW12510.1 Succinate dehydrogenase hydrophobic membrane anchor protein [Rhodovulum sp. PH10]
MKLSSIRTPMAKARGLGSAMSGTEHWWEMRLTAIALVPLTFAAIVIVISLIGRNHAAVAQILGSPLVAIVMLLFVYATTLHMRLGLQSVIEDYIYGKGLKTALLIGNTFLTVVLWLACTYAILKLSFGV